MFTYVLPNETVFFNNLLQYLKKKGENQIYELLKDATCILSSRGSFSNKRWDCQYTEVYFYVNVENLHRFDDFIKAKILKECDILMPKDRGYDIMNIEISPKLEEVEANNSLTNDLEVITKNVDYQSTQTLPSDIKAKGVEMAEVYLYLYCIENTIRIFIEKVCIETHDEDYFQHITISATVRNSISTRKKEEEKNLWLSFRRGSSSDLFYLDFSDLSAIITNNWELFKKYFPDQAWISTKLTEMSKCRNFIAHNSYVGQHEKDLIRLYYNSILKQINNV